MACLLLCLLAVSLPQALFAASSQPGSARISLEAAEKIALDHAGAKAADVTFTEMEFDRERGRSEYEIAFTWNNIRYKYEIDADSGEITRHWQKERKQPRRDGGNTAAPSGDYIGTDAAKAVALKHAAVSADQADFTKVKLDRNRKRGTAKYELDFFANGKKYEYEIGASSSEILEYGVKTRNNRQ